MLYLFWAQEARSAQLLVCGQTNSVKPTVVYDAVTLTRKQCHHSKSSYYSIFPLTFTCCKWRNFPVSQKQHLLRHTSVIVVSHHQRAVFNNIRWWINPSALVRSSSVKKTFYIPDILHHHLVFSHFHAETVACIITTELFFPVSFFTFVREASEAKKLFLEMVLAFYTTQTGE